MIALFPVVEVLQREFYHNSLRAWLIAAITAAVVAVVSLVVRRLLVSRLGAVTARTTTRLDDMVVELVRCTRTYG